MMHMETDILTPDSNNRTDHVGNNENGYIDNTGSLHNGIGTTYGSVCESNIEPVTNVRVYRTRWYILLVFSLTTVLQHAAWDTWGPIAQSSKDVYGWNNAVLTTMINCGNAGAVVGLIPAAYLVNTTGLRPAMIICTTLLTIGCAIRVVSMEHITATILIGVGQFLIGLAGSVTTVLPSVISETWFPCNERTTATAVGIISNAIGGIVAFLLGPNLVAQPREEIFRGQNGTELSKLTGKMSIHSRNKSPSQLSPLNQYEISANTNIAVTVYNLKQIETETKLLLNIESIWGAILLLMTIVYFPSKPKEKPSVSAGVVRLSFKQGFYEILSKRNAILVSLICAVSWGCFGNWLGLLDVIFHYIGVTQKEAGWYGVYGFTSGSIAGLVVGRLVDTFRSRHKLVSTSLFIAGLLFITWISVISAGYVFTTNVLSSVAISLFSVSMYSTMPILYEAACEIAHPAGEEMVGLFVGLAKNATAVIFLLLGIIPEIGTRWITWTMVAITASCVPALLCVEITYNRINLDS